MIRFEQDDGILSFSRWTETKKRMIHEYSLKILSEIGVEVFHDEARELLHSAGAEVEGILVRIPAQMVENALATAPSSYSLFSTNGEEVVRLEPNLVYFGTGTDMPEFIDPYTGEIRAARLEDCANAAKVAQQCESIDWISPYALSNDKDPRVSDMYHYLVMRKYSDKPILTLATDAYSLKGIIDMAACQAGGYENLKEKPTFLHYAEPVSPLQNSEEAVDKLILCGKYGIPVTYTSGIMAGATGPVHLAGTLAIGNAECLAGLVIHQLSSPGAPFMYGMEASIMDMKTTVCMYGGPEYGLMNSFVGEMGRFYHLPSFGISGATDANEIDFQMGAEMIYSMMCAVFGRQNFVHDNGYMGIGQMGSLGAIIAANELLAFVKRYAQDIQINEETIDFDAIREVGPGGEFLNRKDTFRNFRKEFYLPKFLNRYRNAAWIANGSPSISDKFLEKARNIIEEECPVFITTEIENELITLIKEHEKHYGIEC